MTWPARPRIFVPRRNISTIALPGSIHHISIGSLAWSTANSAVYLPVILESAVLIKSLSLANGTVVSGNFDVGLYSADGKRIMSTGSTAQAGTTNSQTVDTTDTPVGPGLFYLACAIDNTTATVAGQ